MCNYKVNNQNRNIYIPIIIIITMAKTTEQKIKETEAKLKELKEKKALEEDKSNWVKIPELKIEIQNKIHDKNKSYDELIEMYGDDLEETLPTYAQLQFLRNSKKYCKELGLLDTWEFVKQEDEISKKNGYVARFGADSDDCCLYCVRYSWYSDSGLGVRFVRGMKK